MRAGLGGTGELSRCIDDSLLRTYTFEARPSPWFVDGRSAFIEIQD